LAVAQGLAVAFALLIHEAKGHEAEPDGGSRENRKSASGGWLPKDTALWAIIGAMVLYHAANAPGGVYLGLFLKRDMHARERMLAYAFAVSMVAWMLVVWPAGWLADPRRSGEAQVIVGSCLVLGSAIGPAAAGLLVDPLGYRGLFAALAGVGILATAIVVFLVPETLHGHDEMKDDETVEPMGTTSDLSTVP
jgi:predicted MFS family arabinose efflux permease